MENLAYLAFALPAFFVFIWMEYQVAKYKKMDLKKLYHYEGSISNISIGIAERLLSLFITGSFYTLFTYIYQHYRIFEIPNKWWVWIALILATDLVWYWYHRLGHEINFLWAAHIVHHQSDEFNFTVAARITTFQALIRNIFWCILPLVGFHPNLVMSILVVHGVYSFFTHTQVIGKLGWLEYIFITPSLHGVHHASDEKYLDKNFGDVFVFWDVIFGTFMREEEKPKYGLTHPLNSYSFLWQHFHYYLELWEAARLENGIKNKLKIWVGSPALLDQDIRPRIEKKFLPQKTAEKNYHFKYKSYLNLQILVAFIMVCYLTYAFQTLELETKLFLTSFILLTLINCGALMEQRKWIYYLEHLRIISVFAYFLWFYDLMPLLFIPIIMGIVFEKAFDLQHWYTNKVLQIDNNKIS